MTVVVQQTMPEGMTLEFLDEVTRAIGVQTDPPPGLVVHTRFVEYGRVRVIDVWDSQEALESFSSRTLVPAMRKLATEHGVDMTQLPETAVTPVNGMVRGR